MPARKRAGNKLTGTRVLCIDNESLILEGMKAMLSGWGCEVFTATSIGGAKSVIRNLMVIRMPSSPTTTSTTR